MIKKLQTLVAFCDKQMSSSILIHNFNEWEVIKERVELWIEKLGDEDVAV